VENHHFLWVKSTISMAIFNSHVGLPEGRVMDQDHRSKHRLPIIMQGGAPH
jgi:hypothetical protein